MVSPLRNQIQLDHDLAKRHSLRRHQGKAFPQVIAMKLLVPRKHFEYGASRRISIPPGSASRRRFRTRGEVNPGIVSSSGVSILGSRWPISSSFRSPDCVFSFRSGFDCSPSARAPPRQTPLQQDSSGDHDLRQFPVALPAENIFRGILHRILHGCYHRAVDGERHTRKWRVSAEVIASMGDIRRDEADSCRSTRPQFSQSIGFVVSIGYSPDSACCGSFSAVASLYGLYRSCLSRLISLTGRTFQVD